MAKVPFPNVPIGEFIDSRPFTPAGLFTYRCLQAQRLLRFPDLAGGDFSAEQRREALDRMVVVQQPLTALALFLNVVALEDFIRGLGARLADKGLGLGEYFPRVSELGIKPVRTPKPRGRRVTDPVYSLLDWVAVNRKYREVLDLNADPVSPNEIGKLNDLVLVRHFVAHNGARVPSWDVDRFEYWEVQADASLNPPPEFVLEMTDLLYITGRRFGSQVAKRVFSKVLAKEPLGRFEQPSHLVLALIEVFDWFGKIVDDDSPLPFPGSPHYEQDVNARNARVRAKLTEQCIEDLRREFPG